MSKRIRMVESQNMSDVGYRRLASAVVASASMEYRHGLLCQMRYEWAKDNCMKILRKKNGKRIVKKVIHDWELSKREIRDNDLFFESEWGKLLLAMIGLDNLDAVRIRRELHKRAEEDMVEWVKELEEKEEQHGNE